MVAMPPDPGLTLDGLLPADLIIETCWPPVVLNMFPPLPLVAMMVAPVFLALTRPCTKAALALKTELADRASRSVKKKGIIR